MMLRRPIPAYIAVTVYLMFFVFTGLLWQSFKAQNHRTQVNARLACERTKLLAPKFIDFYKINGLDAKTLAATQRLVPKKC